MKNSRIRVRPVVGTFLVGLLIPLGITAAYAGLSKSAFQNTGTVYGYTYENQSWIDDSGTDAATLAQTTNGLNAPAGYIGVWAGLYASNGTLCKQSPWEYTPAASSGLGYPTNGTYCGSGNYYSQGESEAYTGSGYDAYHAYQTIEQAFP